jgi:hypothetical protein
MACSGLTGSAGKACSGPLQSEALLTSDLRWDRSRRCALAQKIMSIIKAALADSRPASQVCRPEEDPFVLLQRARIAIEWILLMREGLPLRRTWIERPYGEEEVALLEEEVLPAIRECLERVDQIDDELLATI